MANHLERLASIDETGVKTNMAKTTGWVPCGLRLVDHAPFGHWRTQTFVAALRHDRLDVPRVIDGAMNAEMFDLYTKTQLVPTLRPRDLVFWTISPATRVRPQPCATWVPGSCSCRHTVPDLNPIEMAFSKFKALIRKAAARTYDQLWAAVDQVYALFSDEECYNYFKAAGYETD